MRFSSRRLCVGMALFLKNVAFHGILLDALFEADNHEWKEVYQLLQEGILGGVVQPLKITVFRRDQVEEAFRYMAQGKHIGKVVLQVRISPLNQADPPDEIIYRSRMQFQVDKHVL